ncbi:MAG TPA: hypothetical protein VGR98_27985 [Streptosporangiaceae bacterium]|nr:hypothetical protein [Streptosporangiaceae bacterium]
MATWWVGQQDRGTGVVYVVLQSGNDQFPSGDLPSTSQAAGPYATQAEAQAEADILNKAPGGALGVKPAGQSQWWFYNSHTGQVILDTDAITAAGDMLRTKTGTGWHYYASQIDMLNAIQANNWPPPQYQNSIGQNIANAPKIAGGVLGNLFSLSGGPFSANFWIRAGEVVLGLILLAVGVAKLTGAVPLATKVAGYVR